MVTGVFSIPFDASVASPSGNAESHLALDEFIAGEENALVRSATAALLAGEARYNPLVICGPTGVGKTHLSRGLAARLKQSQHRVIVVTGSDFARAFAAAIETDAVVDFQHRHRRADLLLVEDLDELAGKAAAQRELASTIDDLHVQRRQVMATCSQLPGQIKGLAPSLASRLSGGLTLPLSPPATATRRIIIAKLAQKYQLEITDDATATLADRLTCTVPELNHAVVQMEASLADLRRIDLDLANRYLAELGKRQQPTLAGITSRVGRYFQLKSSELKGPTRRQPVTRARGVAMFIARQLTDYSLDKIGRHFGRRDHTTVLHACRKIESLVQSDPTVQLAVNEITAQL